jgi:signal peptidase I
MGTFIYEHLNYFLYGLVILLTLVEGVFKWVIPGIRKNAGLAGLVETVDSLWVALVVALSLKAVWVQPFTIPSGSMEDTLLVGDYILVKKYEYGYSLWNSTDRFLELKKPQHQEVVVFVYPGDHTKDYIKRCIGLPGDVIQVINKDLYVNGLKQVEPYVKHIDPNTYPKGFLSVDRDNFGPVTVEPGHYFMMGDNRDNSADSRYWGQLDQKLIKGRAWAIYWHSLGLPQFVFLAGFVAGMVLLVMLLLSLARPPAGPEGRKGLSSQVFLIVLCFAVAGVILASSGTEALKDNLLVLKDRVFQVIR